MDIIEGNKLIAEFEKGSKIIWNPLNDGGIKKLTYHKDWIRLMTVIENIKQLNYSIMIDTWAGVEIYDCSTGYPQSPIITVDRNEQTTIEIVWLAVVEFIKWYNQTILKQ